MTSSTDPSGCQGLGASAGGVRVSGSSIADGTAITLRVANLRREFPHAAITARIAVLDDDDELPHKGNWPDIVCWNCVPGQVWAWQVREAPFSGERVTEDADLLQFLTNVRADPRAVAKETVPGPNRVFTSPEETCASMGDPRETTTVFNGGRDGIQLYEQRRHRERVPRHFVERRNRAEELASDAQYDADSYHKTG